MQIRSAFLLALLVASPAAFADVIHDETIDGDISDDRFAPTQGGSLVFGSNTITATVVMGDIDYLTFTVPAGFELVQMNLLAFESVPGNRAFIGLQAGSVFTLDPDFPDPAELLGYALFGSGQVGTDILDNIGNGGGSIGFTGSLQPGDYTLWMQETGEDADTFTLDLVAVPAPTTTALLAMCALGGTRARRRC